MWNTKLRDVTDVEHYANEIFHRCGTQTMGYVIEVEHKLLRYVIGRGTQSIGNAIDVEHKAHGICHQILYNVQNGECVKHNGDKA
jgi:hypothetical protein